MSENICSGNKSIKASCIAGEAAARSDLPLPVGFRFVRGTRTTWPPVGQSAPALWRLSQDHGGWGLCRIRIHLKKWRAIKPADRGMKGDSWRDQRSKFTGWLILKGLK